MLFQVILQIIICITSIKTDDACSSGLCTCKQLNIVNCNGLNLTYIPRVPKNTRILKFEYNILQHVSQNTFVNLTHTSLQQLKCGYNTIQHIDDNAFKYLRALYRLDLSGNPCTLESVYSIINYVKTSKVYILELKNINLKILPFDLFSGMESSNLQKLFLSRNQLNIFNFTIFKPIKLLRALYIRDNQLKDTILDDSVKLNILSLAGNYLQNVPQFCHGDTAYFQSLMYLDLRNNNICVYNPVNVNCLKMLTRLDMSSNCLVNIQTNSFVHLPSLKWLSFQGQRSTKHWFEIQSHAFNNSNLQTLNLFDIAFRIRHVDPLAFVGCSNLHILELSKNILYDSKYVNRPNEVLSKLTSLRRLSMEECELSSLPNIIGNLVNLTYINVIDNSIQTWSDDFWINNTKLRVLLADFNKINTISKQMFPRDFRNRIQTISIAYNPLTCDCDLVWFIEWMHKNTTQFLHYPHGYKCLDITRQICLQNISVFYAIIVVSCLLITVILLASVIYKHRWFIKYQIYIWRHQPNLLLNMAERHFLYDVFISYCFEDSDWILNHVIPKLEEEEHLKLCIHERDFRGGRLIIDNIVQSIEGSRRVLVVLSNGFTKSEWCRFEMTVAQKHVFDLNMEPIVVVLLEEIDSQNMTNSLYALLKTTTYVTWPRDVGTEQIFWENLRQSLNINQ